MKGSWWLGLLLIGWLMQQERRTPAAVAGVRIHHSPGRLRLRFPARMAGTGELTRLQALLSGQEGVEHCSVNLHCASMMIRFDPIRVDSARLLQPLKAMGGAETAPPVVRGGVVSAPSMAVKAGELFGRALFATFVKQTVERSVFTMVTTVLK